MSLTALGHLQRTIDLVRKLCNAKWLLDEVLGPGFEKLVDLFLFDHAADDDDHALSAHVRSPSADG